MVSDIPKERVLDNTISVIAEGYRFMSNRRIRLKSDIFETRLMGQRAISICGEEAAKLFYDNDRFIRKGVVPKRIQKSLFGESGVQLLDGEAHRHRKQMFMSIMTHERLHDLAQITKRKWNDRITNWEQRDKVVLFDEAEEVLCRVACEWAGVPLKEEDVEKRAVDMGQMIDAIGGVGERYQRGKKARIRSEEWIMDIIEQIREGSITPPAETAGAVIAFHKDLQGKLLDTQTAAVELINILRPIIAVGRFITFGALALHDYPDIQAKLKTDHGRYSLMFVQEVRRYYPFAPFLGAKVKENFTWNNYEFKKGTLVLLDLYGTNHDPSVWDHPEKFQPKRFADWKESPFSFIPQGGGEYDIGHRCAGEWATINIMKVSLEFLTKQITYEVPEQDLTYNLIRIPSLPKSGFIITHVKQSS